MTKFGLTLSSEEHAPRRLVEIAALAEEYGFDFVSISDHYHPWIDEQGHAPFVWSVLGAIAERTSSIDVAVGVTCPIMRIHPAVLAQAAATTGHLLDGRFTWGVGTGEALNEHIVGQRWPIAPERIDMLEEAVDIIRQLWSGDEVTVRGEHFTVENARIYDPPSSPIPIVVSAFGPARRRDGRPRRRRAVDRRRCRDHRDVAQGRRSWSRLQPALAVLGAESGGGRRPGAPRLAEHRGPRPAEPGSADAEALRASLLPGHEGDDRRVAGVRSRHGRDRDRRSATP